MIVTIIMSERVVLNKIAGLRTRYNPYHSNKATKAAAVPGANGTRPV